MTQETIAAITAIATGSTGLLVFLLYFTAQLIKDHRASDAANVAKAATDKAEVVAERDLARRERDELRDELDGVRAEVVTALRDTNTGLVLNADVLGRLGKGVDKLVREGRVKP